MKRDAQKGSGWCEWQASRKERVSGDSQVLREGNNEMQMLDGVVGETTGRQMENGVPG